MCTPRRFHPSAFKLSSGDVAAGERRPSAGSSPSPQDQVLDTISHRELAARSVPGEAADRGGKAMEAPPPKLQRRRKRTHGAYPKGQADQGAATDHRATAEPGDRAQAEPAWKVRREAEYAAQEAQAARHRAKVQGRIQALLEAGRRVVPRSQRPTKAPASPPVGSASTRATKASGEAEVETPKEVEVRLQPKQLDAARRLLAEAHRKRAPGHAVLASLPATVVEVTVRIRAGQFLLRPDADLNSLVAGVLGRGQAFTGVCIGAVNVMSGHASWVVAVTSPEQLADFNNRAVGQLGDRVGRLRNMRMRIWGRRNRSIVVDATTTDICDRLKYCMANGTKEHLVTHPARWPGLNSARVFVLGERMLGKWTDFTALGRARRRDPDVPVSDFQVEYEVIHSKVPGLDHLSDEDYRALMGCLCDEAAEEARQVRQAEGLPEPGAPNRLTEVPFEHIPDHIARSPAPAIHAHDPARQRAFRAQLKQYREHLRAVRLGLTKHLERQGALLSGSGIPPTGWRPVDPAQLMPPTGIRLAPSISS